MLTRSGFGDDKKYATNITIFDMDEDHELEVENDESEIIAKLDGVVRDIFHYIAAKHSINSGLTDVSWLCIGTESRGKDVFAILLSVFESRMLLSTHVRYTCFIWIYLCSIKEEYATRMLETLWSIIVRPQVAQVDVAKAHGAAAYLAAFLARANYLDVQVATVWMLRIVNWCIQYVSNCGVTNKQILPGVIRHGTFYALCQAFFIIFSFRYKEMVKNGAIEEVRRWGLGRIVHSPLEPLKYVTRPVGMCFGAITRSLQLVYCNHLLPSDAGTKLPFEPMFPFDSFKLKSSMTLVYPQLRRFSPLSEDRTEVSSALRSSRISSSFNEYEMDFLEEDEKNNGSLRDRTTAGMVQYTNEPSIFTIYSSSPGLKHFGDTVDMNLN